MIAARTSFWQETIWGLCVVDPTCDLAIQWTFFRLFRHRGCYQSEPFRSPLPFQIKISFHDSLPTHHLVAYPSKEPAPVLQADLSEQARFILHKAIKEKSEKLKHLEGTKWLVVINNHLLINEHLYSIAFNKIKTESASIEFEKIFIVYDSTVKQLPTQPSPPE
jgi:hypothetical protein